MRLSSHHGGDSLPAVPRRLALFCLLRGLWPFSSLFIHTVLDEGFLFRALHSALLCILPESPRVPLCSSA